MRVKQQGIILLNTIMMISLLALLVLSYMQLICLYLKATSHLEERNQSLRKLEAAAHQLLLTKNLYETKQACFVHESNPNRLIKRLKEQMGCPMTWDNQQNVYLIEDLGLFPCLQAQENNQIYSTKHWRLTIVSLSNKPVILQLRFAQRGEIYPCKQRNPIQIKSGIISWRYLT